MLSLILTACGGGTETKSSENEKKATPAAAVTNSNTVNLQTQPTTKVDADKKDADDLPAGKTPGNSNVNNTKSQKTPKKDADDLNKKDDDDKNRKSPTDKDRDDDDN